MTIFIYSVANRFICEDFESICIGVVGFEGAPRRQEGREVLDDAEDEHREEVAAESNSKIRIPKVLKVSTNITN